MESPLPPFLSEEPLEGDPPCDWADFLQPKLRRYPNPPKSIRWRYFWHGLEGCVGGVKFDGDDTLFAMKVFFQEKPGVRGWPLENEARAVAVLEKVRTGLRKSSPLPIHVPCDPRTRPDALAALFAFSTEGRRRRMFDKLQPWQRTAIHPSFTRIRNCFGWIRVHGSELVKCNSKIVIDKREEYKGNLAASYFQPDTDYFAIVYELVPAAKMEMDAVQAQLDFFQLTGFSYWQSLRPDNWQGPGLLLDFGDIQPAIGEWFEWTAYSWRQQSAEQVADPEGYSKRMEEWRKMREEERRRAAENGEELDYGHRTRPRKETTLNRSLLWKIDGPRDDEGSDGDGDGEAGIQKPGLFLHIPEVGPRVVMPAWRRYAKLMSEYMSRLQQSGDSGGAS